MRKLSKIIFALFGFGILAGIVLVVGAVFFVSGKTLSGDDCHPRKLTQMTSCRGQDDSFTECRFYFRAVGVPDPAWCQALNADAAHKETAVQCVFSKPATWTRIDCAEMELISFTNCYVCTPSNNLETHKTYVYGYDNACQLGVEQVTCNIEPSTVGELLKR